jgi:hypothetical protein
MVIDPLVHEVLRPAVRSIFFPADIHLIVYSAKAALTMIASAFDHFRNFCPRATGDARFVVEGRRDVFSPIAVVRVPTR